MKGLKSYLMKRKFIKLPLVILSEGVDIRCGMCYHDYMKGELFKSINQTINERTLNESI